MRGKIAAFAAVCTVVAMTSGAASADNWNMQTLWPAGSPNQKIIEDFAGKVKATTGGKVQIKVFPVGALVPFTETLEAVGRGILQAQHTGSVYFSGSEPALALIGELSGAYENADQFNNWFYQEGGLALAREAYQKFNAYYVGPVFWGMESTPSKVAIDKLEDFKGLKIRVTQGIASELMTRLGASPISMPGSEVFSALDKGVIDATDWGTLSMNEQLGLHKVAKYELYPGFFSLPAADVAVNLDVWKALPPETQAQVETAVRDMNNAMTLQILSQDLDIAAKAKAQGLTLIDWSRPEREKFRRAAAEVWKNWAGKSELAKRVYDSHMAHLAKLDLLK